MSAAATKERTQMRSRTYTLRHVQIRDSAAGDGFHITGLAAVFGKPSVDLGGFRETIQRGAFKRALAANPDVVLLVNHKASMVLARTKNGTLSIRESPQGLAIEAEANPTTYAQNLKLLMQRGDVDQMSFAFTIAPGGEEWASAKKGGIRAVTVTDVEQLYDVSVVTNPAYEQTSASMREREDGQHRDDAAARKASLLVKAQASLGNARSQAGL